MISSVNPGEFNLCQKAMPYLQLPKEAPVSEEIEQIQPLLDQMDEKDYKVFMCPRGIELTCGWRLPKPAMALQPSTYGG